MNIIAFSLFGTDPLYTHGMIKNAELASSIYPGWKVVCFVSQSAPKMTVARLTKLGVDVRGPVEGIANEMFWRFTVMDDASAERFIVRDADSRLSKREALAVKDWIESGLDWHTMRDHPHHWLPMGGGLWGAKGGLLNMTDAIKKSGLASRAYNRANGYSLDQTFLSMRLWPTAKKSCLQHDSCTRALWPEAVPFPNGMNGDRFVGEVIDMDDMPYPEQWMMRMNARYAEVAV